MVGAREFWKSRNLGPHVPEFLWDFMVIGSRILGTVPIFSSADLKDKKGRSESKGIRRSYDPQIFEFLFLGFLLCVEILIL